MPSVMRGMASNTKAALRVSLKRHGLSMRKDAMKVALACLERAEEAGEEGESACDKLLEFIEDEGVTSCVVDEQVVALAVKKFESDMNIEGNPLLEQKPETRSMREDVGGDVTFATEVNRRDERGSMAHDSEGGAERQGRRAGYFGGVGGKSKSATPFEAEGPAAAATATRALDNKKKNGRGREKKRTKRVFSVVDVFDKSKPGGYQPLSWDEVHGKFVRRSRASCLMPPATSKMAMFRERFFLLRRRVQRNKAFLKPALEHMTSKTLYCELTEVSALLGCVGEQKFILCMISTVDHEDGGVYVEDLSGSVQVDLSACQFANRGFYTENMIVLVEGCMQTSGVFQASAICFPPLETLENDSLVESLQRERLRESAGGGRGGGGGGGLSSAVGDEMFVAMSDVFLDQPECLQKLAKVFRGFEEAGSAPTLFILMGPFLSKASLLAGDIHKAYTSGFKELAKIVKEHSAIHNHSHLLFVPGPGDPSPLGTSLLPQPRLQPYFTQVLEESLGGPDNHNCIFASNPCRIHHAGQEIVIFRDDLQNKMRRHDLSHVFQGAEAEAEDHQDDDANEGGVVMDVDKSDNPNANTGADADERVNKGGSASSMQGQGGQGDHRHRDQRAHLSFERTCSTVLHQSHLLPLPTFSHPVMWDYDQAMWLLQPPDVLLLGDHSCTSREAQRVLKQSVRDTNTNEEERQTQTQTQTQAEENAEGVVVCVSPGSFSSHNQFVVYTPKNRTAQPSSV